MSRDTTTPDDAAAFEAAATTSGTATSAGETIPGDLLPLCREHICPVCPEKAQADEQRLRALADLENTKKRLQREKDEQVRYAAETVLADLLPTLDNLDLALQYGQGSAECRNMLVGVEMTRKLLLEALGRHGLEAVGEAGEPFTPELHEAMSHEDRGDMPADHVATVMMKGYRLKERLLRPAKVTVSRTPG
ncbi:nucleotide exchange factor GrpE [Nitratidesulfovibrio vulgaris]|jgi:molecular chaperone GrpE|uniref:nucleotide exchange factor GrpE n=1 Tax=Nitratidesulfovibrio vulgaris TaxID=881 RepID=UPI0013DFD5B7|nr:nucleotide exchange factor GrpE [Nitratidesulfovibrio vulgaris]WCB47465.1 nucleotide exchange factor GrpE [Nitratidesulfovibrio vulgaris]